MAWLEIGIIMKNKPTVQNRHLLELTLVTTLMSRILRPDPRQGNLAGLLKQLRSGKKPLRRRHALRLGKLPGVASLRLQPDLLISNAHGSNLGSQGKNSRLHCPRSFAEILPLARMALP